MAIPVSVGVGRFVFEVFEPIQGAGRGWGGRKLGAVSW